MTNHETVPTTAVEHVLDEIARDIADGIYEDAVALDSFAVLHDYVDANDYLILTAERFCPHTWDPEFEDTHMLWQEWVDDLAVLVDARLVAEPMRP